jgi:hypothetical protein
MSRKVHLACERKGCKNTAVLTREKINTLLPGWIQVIHYEVVEDLHSSKKSTDPVLKDICSASCAAKYFHDMLGYEQDKENN